MVYSKYPSCYEHKKIKTIFTEIYLPIQMEKNVINLTKNERFLMLETDPIIRQISVEDRENTVEKLIYGKLDMN